MFRRTVMLSLAAVAALTLTAPLVQAQLPSWYQPYRPAFYRPPIIRVSNMPVTPSQYPQQQPQYPQQPPQYPQQQPPVGQPPVQSVYVVKYKLFGPVAQQTFPDHEHAHAFEERLERIGVASQVDHGQNCYTVRYACPVWKAFETADHEAAHDLEEWLASLGFDAYTKHIR